MKRTFVPHMLVAAMLASATLVSAATWQTLVPEASIIGATGESTYSAGAMGVSSTGLIALLDRQTTHKILLIDNSNVVTVIATAAQISAAIDAANGTDGALATNLISVQCIEFNAAGKILVYTRNSNATTASDQGTLLAIEPTTPFAISVLSCAKDGGNSPVPGGMGMVTIGNTVYLSEDPFYFPNVGTEGIYSIDTTTLVNDGSKTGTFVIGATDLTGASGDSDANQALGDLVARNSTTLIVGNSGIGASNDNLIQVNLSGTPSASLYVAATDIETDLASTDIGYNSMAVDSDGIVYLANAFGAATEDDGVILLSTITPPNATATIELESKIATDLSGTDLNSTGNDGLVYSSSRGGVLLSSGGTAMKGVLLFPVTTEVSDWTLF